MCGDAIVRQARVSCSKRGGGADTAQDDNMLPFEKLTDGIRDYLQRRIAKHFDGNAPDKRVIFVRTFTASRGSR